MEHFLYGVLTAGNLVAAAFFLRFYARTKQRLLLMFALAFLLFTAQQALLGLEVTQREEQANAYLLRLAGFILIIAGIVSTNFGKRHRNE
ncbi:MAG: hypothetical protein IT566_17500 [Rhodospirillaceae bacterium]|nr:hypothetical protein [Rhodospirillaceae bacterium]